MIYTHYYIKSLEHLRKLLKENPNLTEEEWARYKEKNGLYSATVLKWVYTKTEDWNEFINKFRGNKLCLK